MIEKTFRELPSREPDCERGRYGPYFSESIYVYLEKKRIRIYDIVREKIWHSNSVATTKTEYILDREKEKDLARSLMRGSAWACLCENFDDFAEFNEKLEEEE